MKYIKIILVLLFTCTVGLLNGQTKDLLIVRGSINPGPNTTIGLHRVIDGNWEQMITAEKLADIDLFANGFSEIAKSYDILNIPQFMVFDKKGNIVSTNSPRPSDPKLKEMIQKELNK